MNRLRAFVLALLVVASTAAVPLSAVGAGAAGGTVDAGIQNGGETAMAAPSQTAGPAHSPTPTALGVQENDSDERDDDPSTDETIGYVEGYWHDDELAVDDQDGAELEADELEAVVYRSMARVEVLRNRTFQDEPSVEIVDRETYRNETQGRFADANESERLHQNIRFEALFMADRDTDALEEFGGLYGGAVAGYYDPETDEIVIVSDGTDSAEMDEVTLGHELLHAQQDQYHDLQSYQQETRNGANAEDGLIEGEASWLDTRYEQRCGTDWNCITPDSEAGSNSPVPNWGMYFMIYQPYSDGPSFIDHVYDDGGWEAVDALYENPPRHSSEIIRPESYGEYDVEVEVEDRSSDRWERLEVEGGADYSEFGEAAMASMLMYPTWESSGQTQIVPQEEVLTNDETDPLEYDHDYTDGWNGDRLVKYVTDEPSVEESAYVWRTDWTSEDEAAEFVDGYLQLLEYHGAEPVDDRRNTFVIEDRYPGAYYLDDDGETVRIVRAPSVDELEEVREGAAPEGEDTVAGDVSWDLGNESSGTDGNGTDENGTDGNDSAGNDTDGAGAGGADDVDDVDGTDAGTDDQIPGFGVVAAALALLTVAFAVRTASRQR